MKALVVIYESFEAFNRGTTQTFAQADIVIVGHTVVKNRFGSIQ